MNRRRVLAVLAAALALLGATNALVYSLYRSEVRAVSSALDDRLLALGVTAASWLASAEDAALVLGVLVRENHLEDAYLVDSTLRVVAGVRTPAGEPLNLLRLDDERLSRALAGHASAGIGYSIASAGVQAAYFPVQRGGAQLVLAIEAGAEYQAPASGLRRTYAIAVGMTALAAIVFALGLVFALRALERARLAHGRAERLAAVGQMAAMVAHEVRNPLGILRGQIELASERLGHSAPPRERERFSEMLAEVDRLNRLTEEFLALARDAPLDIAEVELGALAAAIADELRRVASDADITATGAVVVEGDAARLRQALLNLVLNALQVGGRGVRIAIEVAAVDDRARVSVIDDGPGVSAEIAASLFEPFASGRAGGTGLGLANARRIAERHGGSLVLESTPGERSARFSLYLPISATRRR